MLGIVTLITIFLGYGFFFRKFFKIEFSHAIVFSFSLILSIYFISAVLNILDASIYCSFFVGISLFVYVIFNFLNNNKIKDIYEIFTYDVIIFVVAIIAYFISIRGLLNYAFWDEYSYWGIVVKEMNVYHGLKFPDQSGQITTAISASYAQLPGIFQYSVSKLIGFKEAHNVFANGLIFVVFSSVALVEKRLFWSIILPLVTVLPSLFFTTVSINSLHLDGSVGAVFAATIAVYIQSKKYNNSLLTFMLIMPMLFISPNIKEAGYWLAYLIILIITTDKLLSKNYRHFAVLFILSLLPILGKLLWCWYLSKIGTVVRSFSQFPGFSIFKLASKKIVSEDHSWVSVSADSFPMIKLMLWKFSPYFYSSTMLYTYVIIAMAAFFIRNYNPSSLKEFFRFLIFLFVGLCLYIAFRLELYLTTFLKVEASTVASHERYFGTYTIVFSFCAISFIKNAFNELSLKSTQELEYKKSYYIFSLAAFFMAIISWKQLLFKLREPNPHYFLERRNLINELIKNSVNDNLQFEGHNLNMLDCYIYRYLEAPYTDPENVKKCLSAINNP